MPSELINHPLWRKGPPWLELESSKWPYTLMLTSYESSDLEMYLAAFSIALTQPIVTPEQHSRYTQLTWVTAWMLRFITTVAEQRWHHTPLSCPCESFMKLRCTKFEFIRHMTLEMKLFISILKYPYPGIVVWRLSLPFSTKRMYYVLVVERPTQTCLKIKSIQ